MSGYPSFNESKFQQFETDEKMSNEESEKIQSDEIESFIDNQEEFASSNIVPTTSSNKPSLAYIPILNKETTNPNSYNWKFTSSPNMQRFALAKFSPSAELLTDKSIRKEIRATNKYFTEWSEDSLSKEPSKKVKLKLKKGIEKHRKNLEKKMKHLREQKDLEELSFCSFKPSISEPRSPRSPQAFYKDMQKKEKIRQEKLEELKEKNKKKSPIFSFTPKLNMNSNKILESCSYTSIPLQERLVKLNKSPEPNYITDPSLSYDYSYYFLPSFIPKINRKSSLLVREKPVDTILYEDAVRRMKNEKKHPELFQMSISETTMNILIKDFIKEFEWCLSIIDIEKSHYLNYLKFKSVLRMLKFINWKNEAEETKQVVEIWELLKQNDGCVRSKDLITALMGIMGYYKPWMEEKSRKFRLNSQQVKAFHTKYKNIYLNRASITPDKDKLEEQAGKFEKIFVTLEKQRDKRLENIRDEKLLEKQISNSHLERKKQLLRCETVGEYSFSKEPEKMHEEKSRRSFNENENENVALTMSNYEISDSSSDFSDFSEESHHSMLIEERSNSTTWIRKLSSNELKAISYVEEAHESEEEDLEHSRLAKKNK